jgi:chloramphenicol 3-O phosphotransferase
MTRPGRIVILNGVPRAGKSSIVAAVQERFDGVWMNVGLDRFKDMTPERYQPGIGLRPGGEAPHLEPLIVTLYAGLYESIATHSRLGVNVVTDVDHHDGYSRPLGILPACARILSGLPAWLIGVRCPIEVVMQRRQATWGRSYEPDGSIPVPILRFQEQVHVPGIYDLEVDTSAMSPAECAEAIRERMETPPTALGRLAAMQPSPLAGEGGA